MRPRGFFRLKCFFSFSIHSSEGGQQEREGGREGDSLAEQVLALVDFQCLSTLPSLNPERSRRNKTFYFRFLYEFSFLHDIIINQEKRKKKVLTHITKSREKMVTAKHIVKVLKENGYKKEEDGKHGEVYKNADNGRCTTVGKHYGGRGVPPGTLSAIKRQTGLKF